MIIENENLIELKPKKKFRKKRFILYPVLTIFMVLLAGLLLFSYGNALLKITQIIKYHLPIITAFRISLIIIFIVFYPKILRHMVKNQPDIDPVKLAHYSRRRYPIVFFLVIEVLIAQGGMAWLINIMLKGVS